MIRRKIFRFFIALTMAAVFGVQAVGAAMPDGLPLARVALSPVYRPALLQGIIIDPAELSKIDLIIDKGDGVDLEAQTLAKYFLAGLTVPARDLWVNLSPYEKGRIIPDGTGSTELGKVFLEQDYLLKQLSAGLLDPDQAQGKKFWDEVYRRTAEKFGTADVPVDAVNRVWIVPQRPVVYEQSRQEAGPGLVKTVAYIVEAKLKVMVEDDYLARGRSADVSLNGAVPAKDDISEAVLREVIVPILEREANEGKNFASLRQAYHSLILAGWLKNKLNAGQDKGKGLSGMYVDRNKTAGVSHGIAGLKETVYDRYVDAFKRGMVNFVREEADPVSGDVLPRKYFSGGFDFNASQSPQVVTALLSPPAPVSCEIVSMGLRFIGPKLRTIQEAALAGGARIRTRSQIPDELMSGKRIQVEVSMFNDQKQAYRLWDKRPWGHEATRLAALEATLEFPLWQEIRKRAAEYQSRGEILNVLDWGTGEGTAISEMARRAKEEGLGNVRFYGFGDMYYPSWQEAPEGVTFIWDTAGGLPSYFKPEEIGLMFSHFGLTHLIPERYVAHMNSMRKLFRPDILILQKNGTTQDSLRMEKVLRSMGFSMTQRPDNHSLIHAVLSDNLPAVQKAPRRVVLSTPEGFSVEQDDGGRCFLRNEYGSFLMQGDFKGQGLTDWRYDPEGHMLSAQVVYIHDLQNQRFRAVFSAADGRFLYELNSRTFFFRGWEFWLKPLQAYVGRLVADKIRNGDRRIAAISFGASSGAEAWTVAAVIERALREAGEDPALWNVSLHGLDLMPHLQQKDFFLSDIAPAFLAAGYDVHRIFELDQASGVASVREPFRAWLQPQRLDFNAPEVSDVLAGFKADILFANHVLEHKSIENKGRLERVFSGRLWAEAAYPSFHLYTTAMYLDGRFRIENGYDRAMSPHQEHDRLRDLALREDRANEQRPEDERLAPGMIADMVLSGFVPKMAEALTLSNIFMSESRLEQSSRLSLLWERMGVQMLVLAARPVLMGDPDTEDLPTLFDRSDRALLVSPVISGPQKKALQMDLARLQWNIARHIAGIEHVLESQKFQVVNELFRAVSVFSMGVAASALLRNREGCVALLTMVLRASTAVIAGLRQEGFKVRLSILQNQTEAVSRFIMNGDIDQGDYAASVDAAEPADMAVIDEAVGRVNAALERLGYFFDGGKDTAVLLAKKNASGQGMYALRLAGPGGSARYDLTFDGSPVLTPVAGQAPGVEASLRAVEDGQWELSWPGHMIRFSAEGDVAASDMVYGDLQGTLRKITQDGYQFLLQANGVPVHLQKLEARQDLMNIRWSGHGKGGVKLRVMTAFFDELETGGVSFDLSGMGFLTRLLQELVSGVPDVQSVSFEGIVEKDTRRAMEGFFMRKALGKSTDEQLPGVLSGTPFGRILEALGFSSMTAQIRKDPVSGDGEFTESVEEFILAGARPPSLAPGGIDLAVAVSPQVQGAVPGLDVPGAVNDPLESIIGIEPVVLGIRSVDDLPALLGLK